MLALIRQNATMLAGPAGSALCVLLAESLPNPEHDQEIRSYSQGRGRRIIAEVTRRAVERGEIRPVSVVGPHLDVGQALLRNYFLFQGSPMDEELGGEIVDAVLLSLFHPSPWTFIPVRKGTSSEGERMGSEQPVHRS